MISMMLKSLLVLLSVTAAQAAGNTAFLIIDVQDCFMEANGTTSGMDGSLSVEDTASLIPVINEIRTSKSCLFDVVVRSQDYHPEAHISFGPTHGLEPFAHLFGKGELPLTCINPDSGMEADASCCPSYHLNSSAFDCDTTLCPDPATTDARVLEATACTVCSESPEECFETTQAMWTNHCLQDGDTTFPPGLYTEDTDIIVQKGGNLYVDAYSAFMDNTKKIKTELDDVMQENGVETIYLAGIATDYCVYYSALDAISLGYDVYLIEDATRGIAADGVEAALADMIEHNVTIIQASDLLAMECPAEEDGSMAVQLGSWMALAAMSFFLM
eukprot:Nitzschia sp. Nitz4//scaffold48_size128905//86685//87674//NITZ4_003610-RA/size128905-processed-gene-0.93-mRNA-1//1//CDS//3329553012//3913//frame0